MMLKYLYFLIITTLFSINLNSQTSKPEIYTIYDTTGKKVSYDDVLNFLSQHEIVLFGELHNNPISHWLELRILKDLNQSYKITLGMEMLESDNQIIVDEYLNNFIREKDFKKEAKMWNNYDTDYAPLVNFAKQNSIPVVATNIPRRFASMVSRLGQDTLLSLPKESRNFIAPLPFEYDSTLIVYQDMASMSGHQMPYIAESQAIKDATMSSYIYDNLPENGIFYHVNGSYHSKNYEGINWYLKRLNNNIKIANIITVEADDIHSFNKIDLKSADFNFVISSDMTKTY